MVSNFLDFMTSNNNNPFFKILIPTHNRISLSLVKIASFTLLLLLLITIIIATTSPIEKTQALSSVSCSLSLSYKDQTQKQETMKVHPLPKKRNNITIQYYVTNNGNNNDNRNDNPSSFGGVGSHKKLRRLPHIFSRVLELPFRSDAEVSVEENPDNFRFVAETEDNIGEVRAHTVEIHPGLTKIVVRPNGFLGYSSLDDLELDMWRFRLPESTRPELASAVFMDGELIVTVPKGEGEDEEEEEEGNEERRGRMGNNGNNNNARLVLVQ